MGLIVGSSPTLALPPSQLAECENYFGPAGRHASDAPREASRRFVTYRNAFEIHVGQQSEKSMKMALDPVMDWLEKKIPGLSVEQVRRILNEPRFELMPEVRGGRSYMLNSSVIYQDGNAVAWVLRLGERSLNDTWQTSFYLKADPQNGQKFLLSMMVEYFPRPDLVAGGQRMAPPVESPSVLRNFANYEDLKILLPMGMTRPSKVFVLNENNTRFLINHLKKLDRLPLIVISRNQLGKLAFDPLILQEKLNFIADIVVVDNPAAEEVLRKHIPISYIPVKGEVVFWHRGLRFDNGSADADKYLVLKPSVLADFAAQDRSSNRGSPMLAQEVIRFFSNTFFESYPEFMQLFLEARYVYKSIRSGSSNAFVAPTMPRFVEKDIVLVPPQPDSSLNPVTKTSVSTTISENKPSVPAPVSKAPKVLLTFGSKFDKPKPELDLKTLIAIDKIKRLAGKMFGDEAAPNSGPLSKAPAQVKQVESKPPEKAPTLLKTLPLEPVKAAVAEEKVVENVAATQAPVLQVETEVANELRAQIASLETQIDDLREENELFVNDNHRIGSENSQLWADAAAFEDRIESLESQLHIATMRLHAAEEMIKHSLHQDAYKRSLRSLPTNLTEVVKYYREQHSDKFIFFDHLEGAMSGSEFYSNPKIVNEIWAALDVMAYDLYPHLFKGDGTNLVSVLDDIRNKTLLEIRMNETAATSKSSELERARTVRYNGIDYVAWPHVRLSFHQRIYFVLMNDEKKIGIFSMPEHLETAGTRRM